MQIDAKDNGRWACRVPATTKRSVRYEEDVAAMIRPQSGDELKEEQGREREEGTLEGKMTRKRRSGGSGVWSRYKEQKL